MLTDFDEWADRVDCEREIADRIQRKEARVELSGRRRGRLVFRSSKLLLYLFRRVRWDVSCDGL